MLLLRQSNKGDLTIMENTKTLENILDLMVDQAKFVIDGEQGQEKNTGQTRTALYGLTKYYSALYDVTTSQSLHNSLDDIWGSVRRYLRGKQDYAETLVDIDNTKQMFKA